MNRLFIPALSFALQALIVAACGGSDAPTPSPPDDPQKTKGVDTDSKSIPKNDEEKGQDDKGQDGTTSKRCVASCAMDSDCANSCPKSSGTACCDLATKTCFSSKESVCPKIDADAGDQPLPY